MEAIRLRAASTAFLAGITVAIGIRSLLRRGDDHGARRFMVAMVSASGFVAFGTALFIAILKLPPQTATGMGGVTAAFAPGVSGGAGAGTELLFIYAGAGFAAGLASALFPLAAGLPLLLIAGLATAIASVSLSSWLPWVDGHEVARLSMFPVTDESTGCILATMDTDGGRSERNLTLPPGPVELVFSSVRISGPCMLVFGEKRYRLEAIATASTSLALHDDTWQATMVQDGNMVTRLLGLSVLPVRTGLLEPSDFASALFTLRSDGTIDMILR